MQKYQQILMQMTQERNIKYLCHFTPEQNIKSIIINGLLSRNILDEHNIDYFYTDTMRLDDNLDGTSLSIHSINKSMFYAKKREAAGSKWSIFILDKNIIWTHNCRFCWKNAATSEIRKHRGFRGGPWAFNKMFEEDMNGTRKNNNIPSYLPTDNAAEIQVIEPISSELILEIIVADEKKKKEIDIFNAENNKNIPVSFIEGLIA